jgi:hypothetical protein
VERLNARLRDLADHIGALDEKRDGETLQHLRFHSGMTRRSIEMPMLGMMSPGARVDVAAFATAIATDPWLARHDSALVASARAVAEAVADPVVASQHYLPPRPPTAEQLHGGGLAGLFGTCRPSRGRRRLTRPEG